MKKMIDSNRFRITYNKSFSDVVRVCSKVKRKDQSGTWITSEMIDAYILLHQRGHAHSVEVWNEDLLVGGLYGVDLPERKIFCGESMFSKMPEASKIGLYFLVEKLKNNGYKLIDCQMYTEHLDRLGAVEIPRKDFISYLSI